MKKIWKIILSILAALVLLVAGFIYYGYHSIYKSEKIGGTRENIPSEVAEATDINKGVADWPNWRGQNFDGKSSLTGIITDWSSGLEKLWEVNFLCQGQATASWSAPVIVGNRLVIPGRDENNDLVFCINTDNGELIWQGSYEAEAGTAHGPGSRATPAINGNNVYTFGRSGDLVCWQLTDGKLVWRKNVNDFGGEEPSHGHSSSPLVYEDMVIVQGGGDALFMAFNKHDGELIWKSNAGLAGFSAPTLFIEKDNPYFLFYHGGGLSCVEPEMGQELWRAPWEFEMNATTPAVEENTVFITSFTKGCEAIEFTSESYKVLWKNDAISAHHSDPIIIEGFLYGYTGFSGRNKGEFKCVELRTGKEMWSTKEVGQGTTTYVDGYLICMDVKGNLFLVKPDTKAFQLIGEIKNLLNEVKYQAWTVPVVANGKLYLRYIQTLVCYDLMPT
ncbi:PQQ-binding-like beta-propeller repeat protein [Bacteroidota bacterium]